MTPPLKLHIADLRSGQQAANDDDGDHYDGHDNYDDHVMMAAAATDSMRRQLQQHCEGCHIIFYYIVCCM